jgi:hypothetical protein
LAVTTSNDVVASLQFFEADAEVGGPRVVLPPSRTKRKGYWGSSYTNTRPLCPQTKQDNPGTADLRVGIQGCIVVVIYGAMRYRI